MFMAITHLFDKGVDTFKNADIEAACAEIRATTSATSIVSADLQETIVRCCGELAQFDVCDILHYVQTDVRLHNVSVHPDLLVNVIEDSTGETIAEFALPAETDPCAVIEICDRLTNATAAQKTVISKDMLYAELRKEGLFPAKIAFDVTHYV